MNIVSNSVRNTMINRVKNKPDTVEPAIGSYFHSVRENTAKNTLNTEKIRAKWAMSQCQSSTPYGEGESLTLLSPTPR